MSDTTSHSDRNTDSDDPNGGNYVWAAQFIEVALRAIRRVHFEYGPWSLGHHWKIDKDHDPGLVNVGRGVELADEVSVCAAISAEFLTSQLVSGARIAGMNRFWEISREENYRTKSDANATMKVDLFLRRFEWDKATGEVSEKDEINPAFIEAKRARCWTADIRTGNAESRCPQYAAVVDDVSKLLKEKNHRNGKLHTHVLVWGCFDSANNSESVSPVEFFEKVNDRLNGSEVVLHQIRWLPLAWEPHRSDTPHLEPPEVTRWLWVSLAEAKDIETDKD